MNIATELFHTLVRKPIDYVHAHLRGHACIATEEPT